MTFTKRLLRYLVLFSCVWITGFENSQCSFLDSSDGDSSSGASGVSVRVQDEQKISANDGNFNGDLDAGNRFGAALADTGDLESDGVQDLAIGAPFDDDGGEDRGAVWVLFMDDNGRVDMERKLSADTGGFDGDLDDGDLFGSALSGLGDINRDGAQDLAVGTPGDDKGGNDRGALWVLFLNADGRVREQQKIADDTGGFSGNLDNDDRFGSAVAAIGDIDGNGTTDLAVGAPGDDKGGNDRGALWVLFLDADGRVRDQQKIADDTGGFSGNLDNDDRFGSAVAAIGDIDGNGVEDIAVGAPGDDTNGTDRGAVWVLLLDADGTVRDQEKIADGAGGFRGGLDNNDRFGSALSGIGEIRGTGYPGLAVGAPNDDDGAADAGAVWILYLDSDGSAAGWQKVSSDAGGFDGNLDAGDNFGAAVAGIGNLDKEGIQDLAVGAPGADDGGTDKGAAWILFMKRD